MTPLAQRIVRELTLSRSRRSFVDPAGLLHLMDDVHCFELTAVRDLMFSMGRECLENGCADERSTFLPAPKTWIEWKYPLGKDVLRVGMLLIERPGGFVQIRSAVELSAGFCSINYGCEFQISGMLEGIHDAKIKGVQFGADVASDINELVLQSLTATVGALACINTPRIIGRRQHMPHRGLERDLVRNQKMIGKFPLHAWTEIVLEVRAPSDMSDAASVEGHLTGRRALHFCRSYLRIRYGKVEIIPSCWRGDPALGFVQSRYSLIPPRVRQ